MCLDTTLIASWTDWNWSGDEIIPSPIVPASRPIPGAAKKIRYNIDIREYLTTTDNAVVAERLAAIIAKLPPDRQAKFRSHSPGSFDFRADTIAASFSDLRYLPNANPDGRSADAWLFPDETLAQRGGDCEDLAFLLAALLTASGISNYCVRVALGTLDITLPPGKTQTHDHCWVMYQNEAGVWEILEPLAKVSARVAKTTLAGIRNGNPSTQVAYIPRYVFNSDHLWLIRAPGSNARDPRLRTYFNQRKFWKNYDPKFAITAHNSIYDAALKTLVPDSALSTIKRVSLLLDLNITAYDPRDHFDDAFIPEAWNRVQQRLAAFAANNADWENFGRAAHSIGDFYAHTTYLHYAALQDPASDQGRAAPYAADDLAGFLVLPQYTTTPPHPDIPPLALATAPFTTNPTLWKGTPQQAAAQWQGRIISGRYSQKKDPAASFTEKITPGIPAELTKAPDYNTRGALPHHDEIAVDSETRGSGHKLYQDIDPADRTSRHSFANQFRWRKNTAIAHIQQALADTRHRPPGSP